MINISGGNQVVRGAYRKDEVSFDSIVKLKINHKNYLIDSINDSLNERSNEIIQIFPRDEIETSVVS